MKNAAARLCTRIKTESFLFLFRRRRKGMNERTLPHKSRLYIENILLVLIRFRMRNQSLYVLICTFNALAHKAEWFVYGLLSWADDCAVLSIYTLFAVYDEVILLGNLVRSATAQKWYGAVAMALASAHCVVLQFIVYTWFQRQVDSMSTRLTVLKQRTLSNCYGNVRIRKNTRSRLPQWKW